MRDLSQEPSASLFDSPPSTAYVQAKDFVRWCCSFGSDFRNSPDITNLRYWSHKNKMKLDEHNETEILEAARPLFLKRVEQAVRKAEKVQAPN